MYFTAISSPCYDPYIKIEYESVGAILTVLDHEDSQIGSCNDDKLCNVYSDCLVDFNLGIDELSVSKSYKLSVFGRNIVNECNSTHTINLRVEFVCGPIPTTTMSPIYDTNDSNDDTGLFLTFEYKYPPQTKSCKLIKSNLTNVSNPRCDG